MATDKYAEEWLEREFVGYGMEPPNPQWPNDSKVCVSFVVQYYMGAEAGVLNGDEKSCGELLEIPKTPSIKGRYESSEQMYEYGAREGVPRLLGLFKKHNTPVTWNFYTRAIERNSYWVKPIVESDAEVSLGGYRWRDNLHDDVQPTVEDEEIQKSIEILQRATGDKTLPKAHKSRQLPLQYSSDSCQDDLPYWIPSPASGPDEGLLMIPFTYDTSDLRFNMRGSGWVCPSDWSTYLKDTFDCFYEEAEAGEPKMMTVVLHPHIVGRPNRTIALESFIKYAQSKGAWFARRTDIAEHWQNKFPYDAKTAFGQGPAPPECDQISIPA
ncbi:carbohydrate esterase family 4 protein [Dothistroma septosporum NZE10]|uniref:Carbohydrate esterase family 4 protein n=1 Tax=Dothistroma septosporum (strain NZE10 / CBS 128990) TaxID=675120 RepID=N1PDE4_DOTSN|nr:carbohydrate esterase family 4 protein [Dothistroma septosporum NZE10]